MSRIGKKPVILPSGVKAELNGSSLSVSGPKGVLQIEIHPKVKVNVAEKEITVDIADKENKKEKSLWGLTRALINNLVEGVTKGFEKKLEVNGVGFKVQVSGQKIIMSLGFSHPVEVEIPNDLSVTVDKNLITIQGSDKQKVGKFAAEVRELKKPEPYKGKGIRYIDEVVRRKAGKVVKVVGGGK
ncbi:MAG: 50S ribosomal protein L6 [Patescibacteria group bacterium]